MNADTDGGLVRGRSWLAVFCLGVLLASTLPTSGSPTEDDAGSGRDAPDARPTDLFVERDVVHRGVLGPEDPADWYAVDVPGPGFFVLRPAGSTAGFRVYDPSGALRADVLTAGLTGWQPYTTWAGQGGTWHVQVDARALSRALGPSTFPLPDAYAFSIGWQNDPPWALDTRARHVPQDDAATGRDAPSIPVDAVPVGPGSVQHGTLLGFGTDPQDVYAFEGRRGDHLVARIAAPNAGVSLYDPLWNHLGHSQSYGSDTSTGWIHHELDRNGTWFLSVRGGQPQHYTIAFGLDGIAPDPRRGGVLPDPAPLPDLFPEDVARRQTDAPFSEDDAHVVIAVIDTGINPYHRFFHAPAHQAHPSNWLPGFPTSATTVPLTLGATDLATARAADAERWGTIQRSTDPIAPEHVYTFPGTRVIAAVSYGEYQDLPVGLFGEQPATAIYDDHGHGTHSAGLASGSDLEDLDRNVVLVVIEGLETRALQWIAAQPWIDAVSMSYGTRANAPLPPPPLAGQLLETMRAADKPVFIASGNGITNTGSADRCSTYTTSSGALGVTRVGAARDESGSASLWHCVPVDALGRTDVRAPDARSTDSFSRATGTSASAPNVAGHFARLLLEVRRAGIEMARSDVLTFLLNESTYAPTGIGLTQPYDPLTGPAVHGFGLVDRAAVDGALRRILAGEQPHLRPDMDDWKEVDHTMRHCLWGGAPTDWTIPVCGWLQDDAGSGRDAGDKADTAVAVGSGRWYQGNLTIDHGSDREDHFHFASAAGTATLDVVGHGRLCVSLIGPEGRSPADCRIRLRPDAVETVTFPLADEGPYRWAFALYWTGDPALYSFRYHLAADAGN